MNLLAYRTGRRFLAFAFYFAEGAPIGFIWWALPAILRARGATLSDIGVFTAALTLPWALKFLWAPLVDVHRRKGFGYKSWIALSQVMMCLFLVPLLFIPIKGGIYWWLVWLLGHSFFAATQDVSVDALIINVIREKETGMLNGYMQAGMLLGRSLFGGAALVLASYFDLQVVIISLIAAIFCVLALLLFFKEPEFTGRSDTGRFAEFRINLRDAFRRRQTWNAIAFALTGAAAFEAAGAFSGPFLTDRGLATETIGFFFGIPVVVSMICGGLAGGYVSDRTGSLRSVPIFLIGMCFIVACLAVCGMLFQGNSWVWIGLYMIIYFFVGMFTAGTYAMFMDITNPRLGATQFSTYMAATNACESWTVWLTGLLAANYSYGPAFLAMCAVSLAGLYFLVRIKPLADGLQKVEV